MSDNENILEFAKQLWGNYIKQRVLELPQIKNGVQYFRAQIVSNPGNGRLVVQRPFEHDALTLPCTSAMANASVGDQVTVYVHGSLSNAVVVADGALTHLG